MSRNALFILIKRKEKMNIDYIKSLLIMFNNKNVYEIETALVIYEFMDKDINSISDAEIFRLYDLIHS